jgi:hypothetical protein
MSSSRSSISLFIIQVLDYHPLKYLLTFYVSNFIEIILYSIYASDLVHVFVGFIYSMHHVFAIAVFIIILLNH